MAIIGIDLGGTRIKGVLMEEDGTILHRIYTPTFDEGQDSVWKSTVAETVNNLITISKDPAPVIGISAPGLPNPSNTAINYMPWRLQGIEGFVWQEYLKIPAWVLNDAVAALVAEAQIGAARNKKHVAMLTLGTGVGGALLLNGEPYQGDFCRAGHLGHIVIDLNGDQDITGMPGSLEDCIGNCSIEKRTNGKYTSSEALIQDYKNGDEYAAGIWLTSVKHLALGIASIINFISPEIIVLGGGITEANAALFDPLNEFMAQYEWRPGGHKVPIIKASQGDLAGAIGAGLYAKSKLVAG